MADFDLDPSYGTALNRKISIGLIALFRLGLLGGLIWLWELWDSRRDFMRASRVADPDFKMALLAFMLILTGWLLIRLIQNPDIQRFGIYLVSKVLETGALVLFWNHVSEPFYRTVTILDRSDVKIVIWAIVFILSLIWPLLWYDQFFSRKT